MAEPRFITAAEVEGQVIPAGGTTDQVLSKESNADFDLKWATGGGGGGSFLSNETARVDATGNDGTGTIGDLTKPFLTVQGAIGAIEDGSFQNPIIDIGNNQFFEDLTVSTLRKVTIISSANVLYNYAFNSITISSPTAEFFPVTLQLQNVGGGNVTYNGLNASGETFTILLQTGYCSDVTSTTAKLDLFTNFIDGAFQGGVSATGFDIRIRNCFSGLNNISIDSDGSAIEVVNSKIHQIMSSDNAVTLIDSRISGTNNSSSTTTYADTFFKNIIFPDDDPHIAGAGYWVAGVLTKSAG